LPEPWMHASRDIMYCSCEQVAEVPLVFDDASESISKTSAAVKLLQTVSRLLNTSDAPRSACDGMTCLARSAQWVQHPARAPITPSSTLIACLFHRPQVGAYADVEKAKASRNIRRGKGKMRNRRYVGRKGPLVVFGEEGGISKAFRNLPGVEVSSVDSLNLLQVRPLPVHLNAQSWAVSDHQHQYHLHVRH
jgi:Ribosomal protein L4/L1 family